MEDCSLYTHSPAHLAVISRDYAALRKIISNLPQLSKAGEVNTEEESLEAELKADEVCAVIDRRDVPGRETPLHVAVRLRDPISTEILMSAGADWSLQNENGWSALQEAVCTREESIAMIIARHYQPLAWAKWCRRLPRIVASASRIRNFYMEMTFHFESSVIPFISRIAPSDTYRIWKRGSNLRADMTLAGFDGFRIQRSDQTFLFLGDGYSSTARKISLPPGALLMLAHKEKEVTNALEGAGSQPSESEVAHEVKLMSQTNMYRPGIDVTQAELVSHLNWRRQERTEMVGNWKAKVYDMLNVMVSVKSRRVPGAITDEELFSVDEEEKIVNGHGTGTGIGVGGEYDDLLTVEERKQLHSAIHMGNNNNNDTSLCEDDEQCFQDAQESSSEVVVVPKEKKGWFGKSMKKSSKMVREKSSDYQRLSSEVSRDVSLEAKRGKEKNGKKKKKKAAAIGTAGGSEFKTESEYKKGLRPVLWLTPDFPLTTEELLPLLDILANKVKAIRRLRELLTTKLPQGTFPVKVAIPVVPTIRVLVTFTKFEEQEEDVQQSEEFATPPTSPTHLEDAKSKQEPGMEGSSTSWMSWVRGNNNNNKGIGVVNDGFKDDVVVVDDDPFNVPSDYVWIDANEKKRRMKAKRAKNRKQHQRKQQQNAAAKNNNNHNNNNREARQNGRGKEIDSEEQPHHRL